MLGFECPCHMVTHPSTDEAQCCLTFKTREEERRTNKEEEEDINNRIEASLLFRTYLMGGVLYLTKHASF